MKIAFLVGSISMGGGNYVICQHAMHAASIGHDVTVAVMNPFTPADLGWHAGLAALRLLSVEEAARERYDIAIATYWKTALKLHHLHAMQYAYFVQSIESRFYPPEQVEHRALVDRTYALGLPGVTEATWIKEYLEQHHGNRYLLARNGIRKDLYTPDGDRHSPRASGKLRVLVEGGFQPPFKNTARTVATVRRSNADEAWLMTSTDIAWYPGVARLFSRVPVHEVSKVYRSCDVIVKLSLVEGMFGPPLEMFHCGGTAVVYDVSGHDEYIVHGVNALVARMHDEQAVVQHLKTLRDSPALLASLKAGAADTAAAWPDWTTSSALFVQHLEILRESSPVSREQLISESQSIEKEFEHILRPSNRRSHQRMPGPFQSLRDKVRQYKQLWGYIREGYR